MRYVAAVTCLCLSPATYWDKLGEAIKSNAAVKKILRFRSGCWAITGSSRHQAWVGKANPAVAVNGKDGLMWLSEEIKDVVRYFTGGSYFSSIKKNLYITTNKVSF